MKKILLGLAAAVSFATPAYAMTYFLVSQWYEHGDQMCKYGNGTVLNVGIHICPLTVQG